MSELTKLALQWYEDFNRYAGDLYPEVYSYAHCLDLAGKALQIKSLAREKRSQLFAHYYQRPEAHEIADYIGDSLALSNQAKNTKPERVDYMAVAFMAQTAKVITGNTTGIYISDSSIVLGCSLVSGTDPFWIQRWKNQNPDGILITYINSPLWLKAMSDYICTSRNTDKIIAHAIKAHPGQKILVLPDKFLGLVMKNRALKLLEEEGGSFDPNLIEIYEHSFNGFHAACYVHEPLGTDAIAIAMDRYPDAVVMAHPECGCVQSCVYDLYKGNVPYLYISTEQMISFAIQSDAKEFIVATEAGHLYALRKRVPDKIFYPVSANAHCKYMKGNNFDKLLVSLKEDRRELIICDEHCHNCIDHINTYENEQVIHLPIESVLKARLGINRMLSIQ